MSEPRSRISRARTWLRLNWVVSTLVAAGFLAPMSWALIHNEETSPLDEWVFIDYTSKVFSQGFVRRGETVGQFTADLMACHGVIPGGTFGACGSGESIFKELPYGGQNGAADYTPMYFWATALIGGTIHLATGLPELTSWRMTGAFWLAAAMLMLYLLFRKWRIPDSTLLPLGLMVIGSPFVFWAHSFVSTDAPSLFIGAALLYLAVRIRRGETPAWWLLITGPVAIAFKVTNLVAIGLAAIYLVGAWLIGSIRRAPPGAVGVPLSARRGLLFPAMMLGLSAAVPLLWSRFLTVTAIPTESADQGISIPLTPAELGLQLTNFLGQTLAQNPLAGLGFDFLWSPLGWLSVAGVLGAVLMLKRWDGRAEIATATAIGAVALAPLLAIALFLTTHSYFQLSARYGASLVPAFMLSLAFITRNFWVRWIIGGYGALLIVSWLVISVHLNSIVPS